MWVNAVRIVEVSLKLFLKLFLKLLKLSSSFICFFVG